MQARFTLQSSAGGEVDSLPKNKESLMLERPGSVGSERLNLSLLYAFKTELHGEEMEFLAT